MFGRSAAFPVVADAVDKDAELAQEVRERFPQALRSGDGGAAADRLAMLVGGTNRFISESELAKLRAEGKDPTKSEPVDRRPLHERLREQEEKKQAEWEAAHPTVATPGVLREDDVEYFERLEAERRRKRQLERQEEARELDEFQRAKRGKVVAAPPPVVAVESTELKSSFAKMRAEKEAKRLADQQARQEAEEKAAREEQAREQPPTALATLAAYGSGSDDDDE